MIREAANSERRKLTHDEVRKMFPGAIEFLEAEAEPDDNSLYDFDTMPDGTKVPYLRFFEKSGTLYLQNYEIGWSGYSKWDPAEKDWLEADDELPEPKDVFVGYDDAAPGKPGKVAIYEPKDENGWKSNVDFSGPVPSLDKDGWRHVSSDLKDFGVGSGGEGLGVGYVLVDEDGDVWLVVQGPGKTTKEVEVTW